MMTMEPRINEPHINFVTRSGVVTRDDKENGRKEVKATWVRKTNEKVFVFDIQKEKEVFMEVKQSFMDVRASTSSIQ